MERALTLNDYNSYIDWDMVLTALKITTPEPRTNYVKLEGTSVTLDLSEALSGCPVYDDRTISASFFLSSGNIKERSETITKIINLFHGRKTIIQEPDDSEHYFVGRVSIDSVINKLSYSSFNLEATCEPWRYNKELTIRTVPVDGTAKAKIYNNGTKTIVPEIFASGSFTITFLGKTYSIKAGANRLPGVKLRPGENEVTLSGSGTVNFEYREAII